VQELSHKVDRLRVSRFVLEQKQAVAFLLQPRLGFLQRVRMVELGRERAARPLKNLPNQVKIFLSVAHQQDMKWRWCQGGFRGSRH
jgi:hypothetical protein